MAQDYTGLNSIKDPDVRTTVQRMMDRLKIAEDQPAKVAAALQPLQNQLASANQLLQTQQKQIGDLRVLIAKGSGATGAPGSPGGFIPPTPDPPTGGDNGPPVTGSISPTDMLDLTTVTVVNSVSDISTWAQTATISLFDFKSPDGAQIDFDKKDGAGRWPDYTPPGFAGPLEYTLWLFLKIAGVWYGSGLIQFWNGLARNGGPPSSMTYNWTSSNSSRWNPMSGHQPAVGEQVGFMVSAGNARDTGVITSVAERSQTILVSMPPNAGGRYS